MDDALVVFPVPLRGEYWPAASGTPRPVNVLALCGSTSIGYQEGQTALVIDQHGNLDWIETDGLSITDQRPVVEETNRG